MTKHNQPCPECGSKKSLSVYEDGEYCHKCFYSTRAEEQEEDKTEPEVPKVLEKSNKWTPLATKFPPLKDRGIDAKAAEKYQTKAVLNNEVKNVAHIYPYFDTQGRHIGNKCRTNFKKSFFIEGDISKSALFGQQAFPGGGKFLTIVEGECFPGDAEVLTPTGWVPFEQYDGQPVYQVDEALNGSFVTPLAKICKDYDGILVENSVRGYYSLTTPDHKLVSRLQNGKLVKHFAKDARSCGSVPRSSVYSGPGVELTNTQLQFCLALSADATFDERKNGDTYVRIAFKKDRKISKFRELLTLLDIKHIETIHSNDQTFFGFTKPNWAIKRFFPQEWISKLSYDQRLFILKELVHWDGNNVPNRNQTEYSSKHKQNIDFVQTLAHTVGIISTIIPRKNQFGSWYKASLLWGKTSSDWQVMKSKEIPYKGIVYCVQVETGMLLIRQQDKITVTGNCDAMAAYQMFGHKYPVVSVKSSSEAVKNVLDNYEYVTSFDEVVLCFDSDKPQVKQDGTVINPGQDAARAVAAILPLGKTKIVTLSKFKDANEYLQNGRSEEFQKEWWGAKEWTPAGIRLGTDLWEDIRTQKNYETVNYPWDGLNALTYGIRLSELVIITADSGVGKTSILKEIEHYLLNNSNRSIGLMHLEEPNSDTGLGLMSIEANKPLHLPDIRSEVKEDELRIYYDKTINSDRVILYDHFGSNDISDLLNKIRHMHALGAKYIVLDHLSIVVSDQSGDERKQLDEISTKLKTLCMELGIAVIAVIHQNRQGQIRGTAGVEQLANIVIKLFRDKESDDPFRRNVTKLLVQKNRFCGRTGPACYLFYNAESGRLGELSPEQVKQYEAGMKQDTTDEW